MIFAASGLCNHIYRCTFATPIKGGEPLCADHKFLDGLKRKLHHRPANRIVLIINTVNCYIDVTAARPVNPKDGNTTFGWIVRIHRLSTRSKISKIPEVTSIE